MLFAIMYKPRDGLSEEGEKRLIQLFTNWRPPAGFEFNVHYDFADGSGGIAIVEAPTPAALHEATAPFVPFLDFRAVPLVEISESVPIVTRAYAWRDSVR